MKNNNLPIQRLTETYGNQSPEGNLSFLCRCERTHTNLANRTVKCNAANGMNIRRAKYRSPGVILEHRQNHHVRDQRAKANVARDSEGQSGHLPPVGEDSCKEQFAAILGIENLWNDVRSDYCAERR